MGVVYRARQVSLDRVVAVKMILAGQLATDEDVQRFYVEAQAAAALDHPGVVPIYEIGEHGGQHYFSMGLVEGQNLAERLSSGPLQPRKAAELTRKVAEAVAYAHAQGVIHRDLKPANVLLDENDQPRITDFGLAKRVEADGGLTDTGSVLGTPNYMPPEQASGKSGLVGPTADVYSLGAILYALLAGRPPFQAATPSETLLQVIEQDAVPLRRLNPTVPRDLETISLKCLEKEPPRRYASAQELAEDLQRFLNGEPIRARPIGSASRAWRWCRRKPLVASLMSALIVVFLAGFAGVVAQWIRAERHAADETEARTKADQEAQRARVAATKEVAARHRADRAVHAIQIGLAARHIEERNFSQALAVLDQCAPQLRHWEWQRLWSMCHRDLRTLVPAKDSAQLVGFGPGDAYLVTVHEGGGPDTRPARVVVWDSDGKALRCSFQVDPWACSGMAFHPDGRLIALGTISGEVELWDLETGKRASRLPARGNFASVVGISPEGRFIVVSDTEGLSVRLLEGNGKVLFDCRKKPDPFVRTVALSPDGERVAFYDAGGLTLWNWMTGVITEVGSVPKYPLWEGAVAFSPDGKRIAIATVSLPDGGIIVSVLDAASGRELFALRAHSRPIRCLAFSPDGKRLASGSDDRAVAVWDLANQERLYTLLGHSASVLSVAFTPDGRRIVSADEDGTVKVWDASGYLGDVVSTSTFIAVEFSRDGRYVAAADKSSVVVRDLVSGARFVLRDPSYRGGSFSLGADGKAAIRNKNGTVRIWEPKTGHTLLTFSTSTGSDDAIAFSPDGRNVACAAGAYLEVWDAHKGRKRLTIAGHNENIYAVAFSGDGKRLASGGQDKTIRLWDAETGREIRVFKGHEDGIRCVSFSPDGAQIASGSRDGTVRLWDVGANAAPLVLRGHRAGVRSVSFTRDGLRLASGGHDGTVRIWDPSTGRQLLVLAGEARYDQPCARVAFSPDGKWLAAAGGPSGLTLFNTWDTPFLPPRPAILRPRLSGRPTTRAGPLTSSGSRHPTTTRASRDEAPPVPESDASSGPAEDSRIRLTFSASVPGDWLLLETRRHAEVKKVTVFKRLPQGQDLAFVFRPEKGGTAEEVTLRLPSTRITPTTYKHISREDLFRVTGSGCPPAAALRPEQTARHAAAIAAFADALRKAAEHATDTMNRASDAGGHSSRVSAELLGIRVSGRTLVSKDWLCLQDVVVVVMPLEPKGQYQRIEVNLEVHRFRNPSGCRRPGAALRA